MAKAVQYDEFGGPEVLHIADVEEPTAGADQVRIRVRAAALNVFETKVRSGALQGSMSARPPLTPGYDVAGVVDQVGADVTGVQVGDEVLGLAIGGGYAELARARHVYPKPSSLSWAEAAAIPTTAEAAYRVLKELAVQSGETLLIHAASGGVGSFAVQLAREWGVRVIGTASAANQGYLSELGAIPVVYGDGLVERVRAVSPDGVDAVFDAAGRGALPASLELAGGPERVITIADPEAERYGVRFSGSAKDRMFEGIGEVARLAGEGKLRVIVERSYPLAEVVEATRRLESGHTRGKLVLLVD